MPDLSDRRRLLKTAVASLAVGVSSNSLAMMALTPRAAAGPFYPDLELLDDDNDLTRVKGIAGTAQGEITDLTGRILDRNGAPIKDAQVEIWQCDINGRYRHSRENANRDMDESFQGFGISHSDNNGLYRFRTIKPTHYPGRTPHIHFLVEIPGEHQLITQMYIDGESANQGDFLFNRMSDEQKRLASVAFEPDASSDRLKAHFDIVLGYSA